MNLVEFLAASCAVWRLSHLLAREVGPGRVFARLRDATRNVPLARGISCMACASVWVAVPFAAWLASGWAEGLVAWAGLSGASVLLTRGTDRRFAMVVEADQEDEEPAAPDTPRDQAAEEPRAG